MTLLESVVNEPVVRHARQLMNNNDILIITTPLLYWGKSLVHSSAWFISYDVETFLPSVFEHSSTLSAYVPLRDGALLPLNICSVWFGGPSDGVMQQVARESADCQLAIFVGPVCRRWGFIRQLCHV
jgi:hypothetical protein